MFQISLFCFVFMLCSTLVQKCRSVSSVHEATDELGYCMYCVSLVHHWICFVINVSHKKYRFQRHTYIWCQIKIMWIEICFWDVVPLHLHGGLVVKMKFILLGLVVTPNTNISAKGTAYLMHTNKHIFTKCVYFIQRTQYFMWGCSPLSSVFPYLYLVSIFYIITSVE
jgi:hypothetical protein